MGVVGFLFSFLLIQTPDSASRSIQDITSLPDLVIEEVSYRTRIYKPEYTPGQPRRGSDGIRMGEFVLLIRNIGSSNFCETFNTSISMAQTEDVMATGVSLGSRTVNHTREIVRPGEILEVTIAARPGFDIGTLVRFRIESPEKEGFLPRYEEERYDNNEFEWVVKK